MGTVIVGLILLGVTALVLKRLMENIKKGRVCSCGGDCKSCGGGCKGGCSYEILNETQGRGMDK